MRHFGARATLLLTGKVFQFLLGMLNTVEVHHGERLVSAVENRQNGTGLFTVSNHASMLDPAILAAMYPWDRDPDRTLQYWPPWTLCTDVFFKVNPILSFWLTAGKAMPITRASPRGLKQKYLRDFHDKLDAGDWCHMFPEGKITQPWRFPKGKSRLGKFLPGVGKLITSCKKNPILLPIYHKGMHDIVPEEEGDPRMPAKPRSLVPKCSKRVDIYIGRPIDVSDILEKRKSMTSTNWESDSKEDLKTWLAISRRVRDAMRELEDEAWGVDGAQLQVEKAEAEAMELVDRREKEKV